MGRLLIVLVLVLSGCERSSSSASPSSSAAAPASVAPTVPSAAPRSPQEARFLADLGTFCSATGDVKKDKNIPEDQQAKEIIGRLVASRPGPEFMRLLRSLAEQPSGEQRYLALRKAAAERGSPDWSCPALEE